MSASAALARQLQSKLVRLGVNDLILVDPDDFSSSSITRAYGTFATALRRAWWSFRRKPQKKVHLIATHLKRINAAESIQSVAENVVVQEAAARLLDRDVIFLCTDDHWGRSIVNQIAHQYLIPVINMGVRIAADGGKIGDGVGVIDVLRPGLPCLWCTQFLRAERIAAESMPRSERERRQREGYVEELDTPAPSVVSFTTALSGMAVTVFLQVVTDFMGDGGEIARLNYNIMDGTVRRGRAGVLDACLCKKVLGFGELKPLPTVSDLKFLHCAAVDRVSDAIVAPKR